MTFKDGIKLFKGRTGSLMNQLMPAAGENFDEFCS